MRTSSAVLRVILTAPPGDGIEARLGRDGGHGVGDFSRRLAQARVGFSVLRAKSSTKGLCTRASIQGTTQRSAASSPAIQAIPRMGVTKMSSSPGGAQCRTLPMEASLDAAGGGESQNAHAADPGALGHAEPGVAAGGVVLLSSDSVPSSVVALTVCAIAVAAKASAIAFFD